MSSRFAVLLFRPMIFRYSNLMQPTRTGMKKINRKQIGLLARFSDSWEMMALPGLQLNAPAAPVSSAPILHDIKENTEWRFEVAFGSKIEVKVGWDFSVCLYCTRSLTFCLASHGRCRTLWYRISPETILHVRRCQSSDIYLAWLSN